jgi:hypothetical protein
MEVRCQLQASFASPLGKVPGTHGIGAWVGHLVGLEAVEMNKSYTTGNQAWAFQPLALHYIDRATRFLSYYSGNT